MIMYLSLSTQVSYLAMGHLNFLIIDQSMSVLLGCCDAEPYLGIDPDCPQRALICLQHSSHPNPNGTIHNLLPIRHLKNSLNQLKFHMADKVAALVDQYSELMDALIDQIKGLKTRKVIQIGTLWVRQLASNEQEYQQLKRLLRNSFEEFSCRDVYRCYNKLTNTSALQRQAVSNIPAYSDIAKVLESLSQSGKARMLIVNKVSQLEGMLEKGELLKRALPEKRVLKENSKEVLLQVANNQLFELRYNKAELKKGSSKYQSVFSKYPLLLHHDYYFQCSTKYTNLLLGVCSEQLKTKSTDISQDLHYNEQSLTFNCSNGCLYREGMFESGRATTTKGLKLLQLILRITQEQMLILLGKNIVCRTPLGRLAKQSLYLHLLLRTQGDWTQIDHNQSCQPLPPKLDNQDRRNEGNPVNIDQIYQQQLYQEPVQIKPEVLDHYVEESKVSFGEQKKISIGPKVTFNLAQKDEQEIPPTLQLLNPVKQRPKIADEVELTHSMNKKLPTLALPNQGNQEKSKIMISLRSSVLGSDSANGQIMERFHKEGKDSEFSQDKLLSPAIITPLKRSQLESDIRSNQYLNEIPSIRGIKKKMSALNSKDGLRKTEMDSEWL